MPNAILLRMKVSSYEKWKIGHDKGHGLRQQFNVRSVTILRDGQDSNQLTVLTRFDSPEDLKRMIGTDNWRDMVKSASVAGMEISFHTVEEETVY